MTTRDALLLALMIILFLVAQWVRYSSRIRRQKNDADSPTDGFRRSAALRLILLLVMVFAFVVVFLLQFRSGSGPR